MHGSTVIGLIKVLQKQDPDALVVMSCDGEGNSFSPWVDYSDNSLYCYDENKQYYGEVVKEMLTPELLKQGFTEEDCDTSAFTKNQRCVVLWPMN